MFLMFFGQGVCRLGSIEAEKQKGEMPRFQQEHITFPFKQILTNGTDHIILVPHSVAVLLH